MIFGSGMFALVVLALWIYCIFDAIATDESKMRNLPKIVWVLIVIFLPTIGSLAWLLLGRPERAGFAPGGETYRGNPRTPRVQPRSSRGGGFVAPDDDPRFLNDLDRRAKQLRAWEDDLRRRERQLRERPDDDGPAKE